MTPPLYQSEVNTEVEDFVAALAEEAGFKVKRYSKTHLWDMTLWKARRKPILVEVKGRTFLWSAPPEAGVFLDVSKAKGIADEATTKACASWFVVVDPGDVARFCWLQPRLLELCAVDTRDVQRHRNDRNDKGDAKYLIPTVWFHPLAMGLI